MKTAILYKAIFTFVLIPAIMLGNNPNDLKGKYTKEKVIKKEFSVNANATLKVDNSYGNIDIITWNENRIEIEVTITTKSNSEDKAQDKLDAISVDFEGSSNLVSARTKFNKGNSSWWKWGGNNNVTMKINYVIKMPITNSVNLENDYGNINLDKLEGHAKIGCDYGKITTKELMGDNNDISFDYTNNCYFEFIKSGEINADYSSFTVAKTKQLNINADYANSNIEIAETITYNCDYGNIKIDQVNTVKGDGDYLTTVIGDVYKNVDLKADYGSIKIKQLTANAGDVLIDSDYVGVTIGFDSGYNFNFNLDLQNASLRDEGNLEISKRNISGKSKKYSGYYGNANSSNTITINSEYGNVSLSKN